MNLYESLIQKNIKLSVTGLGYVGIVLAIAFAKKLDVIGFDINEKKILSYLNKIDPTNEVGSSELNNTDLQFTSNPELLKDAKFHIIAVPTPINPDNTPDLNPLINASKSVGKYLTSDSIVVYESTVYPGVTEDICIPILEKSSGLICGKDFKVGYSPERINPGDHIHTLNKIKKIVSGIDYDSLNIIAKVYELIIEAGIYKASSIKVAEAAKVIENSQRDINIAFVNELSCIFNKMDIDTSEVLNAASTKWNFLDFRPGLVGGHCIGVDPYYLTYKSSLLGYDPQVILAGRSINDNMGKYIGEKTVKTMIKAGINIKNANVAVLGITFKENCPDIRNSKVMDIINELKEYDINIYVSDPIANDIEVKNEYCISLLDIDQIKNMDAVIIAVAHSQYKAFDFKLIKKFYKQSNIPVIIDVKGILSKDSAQKLGYYYWRL